MSAVHYVVVLVLIVVGVVVLVVGVVVVVGEMGIMVMANCNSGGFGCGGGCW